MKKSELLNTLEASREQFLDLIEGLSDEELQQPGVSGEWTIKDILVHLSRWEGELIKLLWQARQGRTPTSIHFGKADVDETNARWYQDARTRPLERALEDFHSVRNQTSLRVEGFSEQDLNDPHRFPWLDGKPLWEWIEGDSFGHEAEHAETIRAWLDSRRASR